MKPSSGDDWLPTFRKFTKHSVAASVRIWKECKALFQSIFNFRSPARILTFATTAACLMMYMLGGGTMSARMLGVLFIGLALALSTFAACWFCVSNQASRYPVFLIALSLIGFLFESDSRTMRFDWLLFLLPFFIAAPIVFTVETTKLLKGRFQKLDSNESAEFREGIQFSIRQLIVVTTIVAVAFGLWNAFRVSIIDYLESNRGQNIAVIVTTVCSPIAIFTLFSVWALLGHWRYYRLIVALLLGSLAIYGASFFAPAMNRGFWIAMFLICWIALVTLLALLRFEGYRFVHRTDSPDCHSHSVV